MTGEGLQLCLSNIYFRSKNLLPFFNSTAHRKIVNQSTFAILLYTQLFAQSLPFLLGNAIRCALKHGIDYFRVMLLYRQFNCRQPIDTWKRLVHHFAPIQPWFDKTWRPGEIELAK